MQNFLQMIWAMQRTGTSLPALFDGQIKAFQAALFALPLTHCMV
jgi:hypothetical protein